MIEIRENAIIEYADGVKEQFEAIYTMAKRVVTGRIYKTNGKEKFKECGFISWQNIKHIYNGSKRKIKRMKS